MLKIKEEVRKKKEEIKEEVNNEKEETKKEKEEITVADDNVTELAESRYVKLLIDNGVGAILIVAVFFLAMGWRRLFLVMLVVAVFLWFYKSPPIHK